MGSREGRVLICTFRLDYHGYLYGLGKKAAAAGRLTDMGRGPAHSQTLPQDFEPFLVPGNPGENWEGCLCCLFKIRVNKLFVHGE